MGDKGVCSIRSEAALTISEIEDPIHERVIPLARLAGIARGFPGESATAADAYQDFIQPAIGEQWSTSGSH